MPLPKAEPPAPLYTEELAAAVWLVSPGKYVAPLPTPAELPNLLKPPEDPLVENDDVPEDGEKADDAPKPPLEADDTKEPGEAAPNDVELPGGPKDVVVDTELRPARPVEPKSPNCPLSAVPLLELPTSAVNT